MNYRHAKISRRVFASLAAFAVLSISVANATAATSRRPSWESLSNVVDAYFAKLRGYQPGAIITRSEVEPLWQMLARAKWVVPQEDQDAIMNRIPTDEDFLVRQLRTDNGRRFTRNVAIKYPEIYDRMDWLSHTSGGGKPAVSGLIAAPDAALTVKYMMSKNGAASWASLLPERNSFNKPTGRIYTADALKSHLRQLYTAK